MSKLETEALLFRKEFFDNSETTINGSYKWDTCRCNYLEWCKMIHNNLDIKIVKPKFGTSHTLFALNEDYLIVGVINLRHSITDFYKNSGHIGYSVRPSFRNKGIATEMIFLILPIAKEVGLAEVLLVCDKTNIASMKAITKNSGILNREVSVEKVEKLEYIIKIL